jgi:hypothetical protein
MLGQRRERGALRGHGSSCPFWASWGARWALPGPARPALERTEAAAKGLGASLTAGVLGGVKGKPCWPRLADDAIEHEGMEVDVQLKAAPHR